MQYESMDQVNKAIEGILEIKGNAVVVLAEAKLKGSLIDQLIYTGVFASDQAVRDTVRWLIRRAAASLGIVSSSIQTLYEAMGRKDVTGLTVPAITGNVLYNFNTDVFRTGTRRIFGNI